MKEMSQIDIGWLAGIIEGEGCLQVRKATNAKNAKLFTISVGMTDQDVINRLYEITGAGSVRFRKRLKPHYKDQWIWQVGNRNDVLSLLLTIIPLLGERRRGKALEIVDAAIEAIERSKVCVNGHRNAPENRYRNGSCKPCGKERDRIRYLR